MQIEYVVWEDSTALLGWQSQETFEAFCEAENLRIHSIGFLSFENENCIVLVQSIGASQITETMKIPKRAIVWREKIDFRGLGKFELFGK